MGRRPGHAKAFITGAASGIGAELARRYAARPGAVLALVDLRNDDNLASVAEQCRSAGATVETYAVDVTDGDRMTSVIEQAWETASGFDVVVASAGIAPPNSTTEIEAGHSGIPTAVINVNLIGVMNTTIPFIPLMKQQGHGRLVALASASGIPVTRRHTSISAYAISKQAVRNWVQALNRVHLRKAPGVSAIALSPGFIMTPMVANGFDDNNIKFAAFLMTVKDAVDKMIVAIDGSSWELIMPWQWRCVECCMPECTPRWCYMLCLGCMYPCHRYPSKKHIEEVRRPMLGQSMEP